MIDNIPDELWMIATQTNLPYWKIECSGLGHGEKEIKMEWKYICKEKGEKEKRIAQNRQIIIILTSIYKTMKLQLFSHD